MRERGSDDVFEPAGVEIGRDLDEERPAGFGLVTRSDHAQDQIVKRIAPLQVAQAGRVGRRNVDGQIVAERGERLDPEHIVLDPVGRVPVGADIDADQSRRATGRAAQEARPRPLEAVVVEAEAVDDGRVLSQAKQARPGVPVLRPRGQRTDLDEAETELQHRAGDFGVLVEAGGKPEGVGKAQPEDLDRKPGIGRRRLRRRGDLQRVDRRAMRGLRRQTLENVACDPGEPHALRVPNKWRPFGSSLSGRDHRTALIGKGA